MTTSDDQIGCSVAIQICIDQTREMCRPRRSALLCGEVNRPHHRLGAGAKFERPASLTTDQGPVFINVTDRQSLRPSQKTQLPRGNYSTVSIAEQSNESATIVGARPATNSAASDLPSALRIDVAHNLRSAVGTTHQRK